MVYLAPARNVWVEAAPTSSLETTCCEGPTERWSTNRVSLQCQPKSSRCQLSPCWAAGGPGTLACTSSGRWAKSGWSGGCWGASSGPGLSGWWTWKQMKNTWINEVPLGGGDIVTHYLDFPLDSLRMTAFVSVSSMALTTSPFNLSKPLCPVLLPPSSKVSDATTNIWIKVLFYLLSCSTTFF